MEIVVAWRAGETNQVIRRFVEIALESSEPRKGVL
jgi:hypothetical protein